MKIECQNGRDVAKRMVFLAWKASKVEGYGVFQDKGEKNEDEVWNHMGGDYGRRNEEDELVNCDYVYGRMMKLYFSYGKDFVEDNGHSWRIDCQGFCGRYPSFTVLANEAIKQLTTEATGENTAR